MGGHVADQAEYLLPFPLQPGLVDLSVLRMQLHLQDLLLLGRQVGGYLLLGAAQDERPDPPPELGQALGVTLPLDWPGVVVAEPVRAGEQPRRGDGQQRPQFHQVVLQRRARDRDLHRGGQSARALIDLRLAVLGLLGLIEQQPGPAQCGVGSEVDAQQGVGRDDDIGACGELGEFPPAAGHGAGYRHHGQVRGEPRGLGGPVGHHAGRGDDQERAARRILLPGVTDQGEALQRLAQAHVVGEDSAQPVLPEKGQPAEPVLLVRAQPGPQPGRRLGSVRTAGRQQPLDLLLPYRRLMSDHS